MTLPRANCHYKCHDASTDLELDLAILTKLSVCVRRLRPSHPSWFFHVQLPSPLIDDPAQHPVAR